MYYYNVFGLNFASELEMPMLIAISKPDNIDVNVRFGIVPDRLEDAVDSRVLFDSKPGHFLLRFNSYPLKYHITNGNLITIQNNDFEDWEFIRIFLLTASFAAIFHQRNSIPLHASGVLVDGEAVLFAGNSGAGKSTTAAALRRKGYTLVADDLSIIHKDNNGQIVVEPGVPFVKLWKDSFELLEQDIPENSRIRKEVEKYFLPTTDLVSQAVPIKRIYFLEKSVKLKEPTITDISSIDAINNLRIGTYRYYYLIGMGGENEHFKLSFQLGNRGIVKHLVRPEKYPVNKLIEFVEQDLKK